jgi:hypothetical protein
MRMAGVSDFFSNRIPEVLQAQGPRGAVEHRLHGEFYEFHDTNRLMASWWKEDKKFTNQAMVGMGQ